MSKETRTAMLAKFIELGQTAIKNAGASNIQTSEWSKAIGQESTNRAVSQLHSEITTSIHSAAASAGMSALTKRQQAASTAVLGIMAMGADTYVRTVAQEALRQPRADEFESSYRGNFGNTDSGKMPLVAQEYFRRNGMETDLGLTWAINVQAVETQSAAAEAIYPTITLNPTDTTITVRTKKTTTTRGILNALLEKDSVKDQRRNLLDAYTDHTVLEDDGIKLVPYRMEDDANATYFIEKGLVDDEMVTLGRCPSYPTNWLNADVSEMNLFQLSAHPGVVQQGFDETDEIGPGTSMGSILVSIRKKGQTVKQGQLVRLNTLNMRTASFLVPPEGEGKEIVMNMRDTLFTLNVNTRDIKGEPIEAAKELDNASLSMRYEIDMNMSLYVQGERSGQLVIRGKSLKIKDFRSTEDGSVRPHDTGSVKAVKENIEISIVGFKIAATRTNDNRRTQGIQIDPVWETEKYMVRYGTPFLSKGPIGETDDDAERLDELMTAVNVRNDIIAVTQTLNYTEQVKEVHEGIVNDFDSTYPITGLGRLWIRPYYKYSEFRIENVNSLESKDALLNASAKLEAQLAADISVAVQVSRYMVAARAYCRDKNIVPTVVIWTDEVVATLLSIGKPGETRKLGDLFNYELYTIQDQRWRRRDEAHPEQIIRRLQWFLKLHSEENTYNILNWGNHFWRPVTVTNINIQRNGAVAKELAVQPCNAHVNHCPITGVFEIFGLEELPARKLLLSVETTSTNVGDGGNVLPDLDPVKP